MPRSRTRSTTPDARRARWEAAAKQALGPKADGGRLPLLVGPPEHPDEAFLDEVGFPGEPPFSRGIQPTMYRGRLWTYRPNTGFESATATNRRFRFLLESGATGVSVAFDRPTQNGYDSDDPRSKGEVGRAGVPISSLDDIRALFAGLPLDRATVSLGVNAAAPVLTALLVAFAEESGIPRVRLGGTVQNDVLQEYVTRGSSIFPAGPSLRLATDLIEFATREMPRWNPLSVAGYPMREAGATAVQEVAFTIAHAIAYVRAARERRIDLDRFLPRLSFFFSSDRNFLEEIAKFRAARRLWGRVAEETFGVTKSRSKQMRFHAQTSVSSLTAQQPELNVVRTTLGGIAAVLGGTQSLHTNALDEGRGPPSEPSARLALRTQQILAEESGVANTVDPLGGSYAIEYLTDRVEEGARVYLDRIETMGGAVAALDRAYFSSEIAREAGRTARAREQKQEVVVGVNDFTHASGKFSLFPENGRRRAALERTSPSRERRRATSVRQWRRSRDTRTSQARLDALSLGTERGDNTMPLVLAAVRAGATLGEVAGVWREIFGASAPARKV